MQKADGHDDISIRMIKTCDKSLSKPLILLFHNSIKSSCYPNIQKKSNILPVHQKSDEKLFKNYQTISLLPTFVKTFEKINFNRLYKFLLDERNPNQSGFCPADSTRFRIKVCYITLSLYVSFGDLMIFLKTTYLVDFKGFF